LASLTLMSMTAALSVATPMICFDVSSKNPIHCSRQRQ
jgi:hypothetical protein